METTSRLAIRRRVRLVVLCGLLTLLGALIGAEAAQSCRPGTNDCGTDMDCVNCGDGFRCAVQPAECCYGTICGAGMVCARCAGGGRCAVPPFECCYGDICGEGMVCARCAGGGRCAVPSFECCYGDICGEGMVCARCAGGGRCAVPPWECCYGEICGEGMTCIVDAYGSRCGVAPGTTTGGGGPGRGAGPGGGGGAGGGGGGGGQPPPLPPPAVIETGGGTVIIGPSGAVSSIEGGEGEASCAALQQEINGFATEVRNLEASVDEAKAIEAMTWARLEESIGGPGSSAPNQRDFAAQCHLEPPEPGSSRERACAFAHHLVRQDADAVSERKALESQLNGGQEVLSELQAIHAYECEGIGTQPPPLVPPEPPIEPTVPTTPQPPEPPEPPKPPVKQEPPGGGGGTNPNAVVLRFVEGELRIRTYGMPDIPEIQRRSVPAAGSIPLGFEKRWDTGHAICEGSVSYEAPQEIPLVRGQGGGSRYDGSVKAKMSGSATISFKGLGYDREVGVSLTSPDRQWAEEITKNDSLASFAIGNSGKAAGGRATHGTGDWDSGQQTYEHGWDLYYVGEKEKRYFVLELEANCSAGMYQPSQENRIRIWYELMKP